MVDPKVEEVKIVMIGGNIHLVIFSTKWTISSQELLSGTVVNNQVLSWGLQAAIFSVSFLADGSVFAKKYSSFRFFLF